MAVVAKVGRLERGRRHVDVDVAQRVGYRTQPVEQVPELGQDILIAKEREPAVDRVVGVVRLVQDLADPDGRDAARPVDGGDRPDVAQEDFLEGWIGARLSVADRLDRLARPAIRRRFEERFTAGTMARAYARIYKQLAQMGAPASQAA